MWRENCFHCPRASRTEYNKVAWGAQTSTTSCNILQNKRNVVSYNICLVKKFDSDQTSCNKTQHDTTRYNKVAKRVEHFTQHQSCMMLYEMYSFGRGLMKTVIKIIISSKWSTFSSAGFGCRIHVNQPLLVVRSPTMKFLAE